VFIIQLVGGILAFVFQDDLDVILKNSMKDLMTAYSLQTPDGEFARQTWDSIQQDVRLNIFQKLIAWQKFKDQNSKSN